MVIVTLQRHEKSQRYYETSLFRNQVGCFGILRILITNNDDSKTKTNYICSCHEHHNATCNVLLLFSMIRSRNVVTLENCLILKTVCLPQRLKGVLCFWLCCIIVVLIILISIHNYVKKTSVKWVEQKISYCL